MSFSGHKHRYLPAIIILFSAAALVCGLEAVRYYNATQSKKRVYDEPLKPAPKTREPLAGIGEGFFVDENFKTHLPLVIIDTGGAVPQISHYYIDQVGRGTLIHGEDRYINGSMRLINTGDMNGINDIPEVESLIQIRRRGNTSMSFRKAQYKIKLVTESGERNDKNILGMGMEWEWVLNGSMADKSMIRNYLPYRIASKIIPNTPDSVYCEVIYKSGDNYRYDGVYLFIESLKQGPDRIDIPRYRIADPFPSYYVRRDRWRDSAILLDTHLYTAKPSDRPRNNNLPIALLYPGRNIINQATIDYVTRDLYRVEAILYSNDPSVFNTYPRYIDVDSFVDYFIVNEFFCNYDAGWHSTFMHKVGQGKLKMGPIWDYDNATDNFRYAPLETQYTVFQEAPLYERLTLDKAFLRKIHRRYTELRKGPLSDNNIHNTIDEINLHLGPAIEREWHRWGQYYKRFYSPISMVNTIDDDGFEITRDLPEQRLEIYRIRTAILEHSRLMMPHLTTLEWQTQFDTGYQSLRGLFLLFASIIFFIPLIFIARR